MACARPRRATDLSATHAIMPPVTGPGAVRSRLRSTPAIERGGIWTAPSEGVAPVRADR